jgi:hypothetical protein
MPSDVPVLVRLRRALSHRPGAELYRYTQPPREVSQWPNRRGPASLRAAGRECERCRRVVEAGA